ncbi:winged helix-turn-helix transcriptional regulator [Millisia brevis]|uniref:winged helix-turn-helix transcriptional regulator n=1 Tax=Millisia brevis TaxID=264148 RepID=UPI000831EFA3
MGSGRVALVNAHDDNLEANVFARACGSREALQNVTGRWGALALAALAEGTFRFNELRRRVDGVSERMLAQTLQSLERDGLVVRTVVQAIPPRVEYSLTPLGVRAAESLVALIEVLESGLGDIVAARDAYDEQRNVS